MKNLKRAICTMVAFSVLAGLQSCKEKDDLYLDNSKSELVAIRDAMMEKIRATSLSLDPDNDFATIMKLHHQAAIDIARKELQDGKNQRMKTIAEKVIAEKTSENERFTNFLNFHLSHIKSPEFNKEILMNLERADKNIHIQTLTGDIDKDFAAIMILHNESTIANTRLALLYGDLQTLKLLGADIIAENDQETRYLQAWLLGNRNPD